MLLTKKSKRKSCWHATLTPPLGTWAELTLSTGSKDGLCGLVNDVQNMVRINDYVVDDKLVLELHT